MNKDMKTTRIAFAVLVALALGGCTTSLDVRREVDQHNRSVAGEAERLIAERAAGQQVQLRPVMSDRPYVDVRPMKRASRYPAEFSEHVTYNNVPLNTVAQRVYDQFKIRMSFQTPSVQKGSAGPAPMAYAGGDSSAAPSLQDAISVLGSTNAAVVSSAAPSIGPVNFNGTLKDLFEVIAARSGLSMKYDEGSRQVSFFRFEEAILDIAAAPQIREMSADLAGQTKASGSDGETSGAFTTGSLSQKNEIYESLDKMIAKLVSAEGTYTISPYSSTVFVRDVPDRVDMVRRVVEDFNFAVSTLVDIEISVYRVKVGKSDHKAVNLTAAFQKVLEGAGYSLELATDNALTESNLSKFVLSVPQRGSDGTLNKWGGSNAMLQALTTLGDAAQTETASISAVNNRASSVRRIQLTRYLREMSNNFTGQNNGNAVTTGPTLTPGTEVTGLNVFAIPHVLRDGQTLSLSMVISALELDGIDAYGNDQGRIQLPQSSGSEFMPETWMRSGQMLVLTGLSRQKSSSENKSPIGRAWWLGGSKSVDTAKEMVVITVRPIVSQRRSGV